MSNKIHSDAPEIRALCLAGFPDYKGRKFSADVFTPRTLISMWCEGSRDYFALVDMVTFKAVELPQGIGELSKLPTGTALIQNTIYRSRDLGCCAFVPAENMAPLLTTGEAPLPIDQRIVLCATRSYKSSYAGRKDNRFYEANNYTGINATAYATAKAALIVSGHLTKAGAITDKGRNAIGHGDMHALGREFRGEPSPEVTQAEDCFTGEAIPEPELPLEMTTIAEPIAPEQEPVHAVAVAPQALPTAERAAYFMRFIMPMDAAPTMPVAPSRKAALELASL